MHWAFEEGLPLQKQMSASEYADQLLAHATPQDIAGWWTHDMGTWMDESIAMREELFAEVETAQPADTPLRLDYQFVYDWQPDMEHRLLQSGIRTAAFLDWVFAEAPDP